MRISSESMQRVQRRMADLAARLSEVVPSDAPPATATFHQRVQRHWAAASTPADLQPIIDAAAAQHHLRPALLRAVIQTESGFNPLAASPKGAQGLMQLMPGTAAGLGVTDPFDPSQNIMAGAHYLRQQLDRFGGDERLALAAYNAGPGAVQRFNGIPPYPETQRYVSAVLARAGDE